MNNKNYSGGSNNIVRTLGSSAHAKEDRQNEDFYETDKLTLELFFNQFQKDGFMLCNYNVWEPACGTGAISNYLKSLNMSVFSTDIVDRSGYADELIDFLHPGFDISKCPKEVDIIITNPPYSIATDFCRKALEIIKENGLVIMYLRILFLEGKERYELFQKYPPKYVYVHSSRQGCAKNGDWNKYGHGGAIAFSWFVWQKGWTGESTIRWIK